MRYARIAILVALAATAGCTAPTQKIAAYAVNREDAQTQSVVRDLGAIAKQQTVDGQAAAARLAAEKSDPDGAQKAVEKAVTMFDTINGLEKEYLKARYGFGAYVKLYIYEQEGFFDILAQEWKAAELQSAARKLAENNQPSPASQSATWKTGG